MDNFLNQSQLIDEIISQKNISEIKKHYKEISLKYREENIQSSSVISSDIQALSYISSRMGETSIIAYNVLYKLNSFTPLNKNISSILDLGSGTGSIFWALKNFISTAKITAVEKQANMIKYSKILSKPLDYDINFVNSDVLSSKVKELEAFDLVIESFMLNEMTFSDRTKTLDLMYNKSKKYIILIEPGTPNSFEKMMQDRNYLLSKGMQLLLPCPHSDNCKLQNDYCNFSVRVNRTKLSKSIKDGTLGYEDEKYFYLIFAKEPQDFNHQATILRKPVYAKNRIELKLCNKDGSIIKKIITKNNKSQYSEIKKLKHGDFVNLYLN